MIHERGSGTYRVDQRADRSISCKMGAYDRASAPEPRPEGSSKLSTRGESGEEVILQDGGQRGNRTALPTRNYETTPTENPNEAKCPVRETPCARKENSDVH